jgi:hypothetical protein
MRPLKTRSGSRSDGLVSRPPKSSARHRLNRRAPLEPIKGELVAQVEQFHHRTCTVPRVNNARRDHEAAEGVHDPAAPGKTASHVRSFRDYDDLRFRGPFDPF